MLWLSHFDGFFHLPKQKHNFFSTILSFLTNLMYFFFLQINLFSLNFRLQEDPPTGVSGAPTDNNIMIWNAVIFGPHDTPFEDGTFKLTIEFTEEYPNKPPTVRFVSKMFHPNVYADGGICLDILQNRWSPTYDVSAILTSIQVRKKKLQLFLNCHKQQKKSQYIIISILNL